MLKKTYKVLVDGYHGHHDSFTSLTPPSHGVPPDPNMEKLDPLLNEEQIKTASAVIIEPVIDTWNDERIAWLQKLRALCTKYDTVLIFDEVITGFRFLHHSVARASGVTPDLIILGKAMAQGAALAAVGGKAKVMDGSYFVSSTYAGETTALAACKAVCETLLTNPRYKIENLWEAGGRFIERFNEYSDVTGVSLKAYPTRGVFVGDSLAVSLFRQEACKAGYLLHTSWFYNFPLQRYDDVFFDFLHVYSEKYRRGEVKLEGTMPVAPFAQQVRERSR